MQECDGEDPVNEDILGVPGIRQSVGKDDPLFDGVDLHEQLWDLGYCEIYAVSDLTVLGHDAVAQGVLIVADAWNLDARQMPFIEWWVGEDNGLLVTGSGAKWAAANEGDVSEYPMNRVMKPLQMQWTDRKFE